MTAEEPLGGLGFGRGRPPIRLAAARLIQIAWAARKRSEGAAGRSRLVRLIPCPRLYVGHESAAFPAREIHSEEERGERRGGR